MNLFQVKQEQNQPKADTTGRNLQLGSASLGLAGAILPFTPFAPLAPVAQAGSAGLGVASMLRKSPEQEKSSDNVGYSESALNRRMESSKTALPDLLTAQKEVYKLDMPYEQKLEYLRPINMAIEQYKQRYA